MSKKLVIIVFKSNQLCVYGKDILRIRYQNNLSRQKVCDEMNKIGYGYYQKKLSRFEKRELVCLPASEIANLIKALGGTIKI